MDGNPETRATLHSITSDFAVVAAHAAQFLHENPSSSSRVQTSTQCNFQHNQSGTDTSSLSSPQVESTIGANLQLKQPLEPGLNFEEISLFSKSREISDTSSNQFLERKSPASLYTTDDHGQFGIDYNSSYVTDQSSHKNDHTNQQRAARILHQNFQVQSQSQSEEHRYQIDKAYDTRQHEMRKNENDLKGTSENSANSTSDNNRYHPAYVRSRSETSHQRPATPTLLELITPKTPVLGHKSTTSQPSSRCSSAIVRKVRHDSTKFDSKNKVNVAESEPQTQEASRQVNGLFSSSAPVTFRSWYGETLQFEELHQNSSILHNNTDPPFDGSYRHTDTSKSRETHNSRYIPEGIDKHTLTDKNGLSFSSDQLACKDDPHKCSQEKHCHRLPWEFSNNKQDDVKKPSDKMVKTPPSQIAVCHVINATAERDGGLSSVSLLETTSRSRPRSGRRSGNTLSSSMPPSPNPLDHDAEGMVHSYRTICILKSSFLFFLFRMRNF